MTPEQILTIVQEMIEESVSLLPRKVAILDGGFMLYYRTHTMNVTIEIDETGSAAVMIEEDGQVKIFDILNVEECDFKKIFKCIC